jgi:excisionase family DNA binding protein
LDYNLTVRDVKKIHSVDKTTIYRWMRVRGYPSKSVGGARRFAREEIDRWIEEQNKKGDKAKDENKTDRV